MFLVLIVVLGYFLAGLVAVIVLARSLARREISLVWKIGAPLGLAFVVWAIPYGDHMVGKFKFQKLCEVEAGLRIYKVANGVKGFRSSFAAKSTPRDLGYQYVERINSNGSVDRYSVQSDGKVVEEKSVTPVSRYEFSIVQSKLETQISRKSEAVVDLLNQEKLAEYIEYGHAGGWLYRQLAGMHAYRNICPAGGMSPALIIQSVLKP